MSKRPTFHAQAGHYLQAIRRARGWGLRQAVLIAYRKKLPVSLSVLNRLEHGATKHPSPTVLKAVAALYEISYDAIAEQFYGGGEYSDLPRHARGASSADAGGITDAVALARLRERHDALRRDVITITNTLVAITERIEQESGPLPIADPSPGTHRSRRTS